MTEVVRYDQSDTKFQLIKFSSNEVLNYKVHKSQNTPSKRVPSLEVLPKKAGQVGQGQARLGYVQINSYEKVMS
jgi:hypothetical protein